ncbi:ATP-dependent DNA helicase [Halogeometricum luteum]|uniref:ATP-dependent DNA helicase n=1 Tax=Halogeometricum luteum TaxID=2950537 RepID=A0ABU2FWM6_9EURY|nr:ATP-dependent DNA helicase [Halogeometricum sp. S3BR5-2]MDS0292938.1 ATP-dependent DNA helicase [Halogeometricum sp. S3BR5-2]
MTAATRVRRVNWQAVFGHPEPYPEQADGIDAAVDAAEDGGFLVVEGACGTGKTMLALTAGIDRVRDPDSDYERVLVLTSVKQQLRQFEQDLRTINDNLPDDWNPVSALTLVGKADVCPYSRENVAAIDDSTVYDRCEGLRERTRNLVGDGGLTSTGKLVKEARAAQTGLLDSGSTTGPDYLETAGEPTPYLPETSEYEDTEYCPFYATFLDDLPEDGDPIEAVPFDVTESGLIDTEELVRLSAGYGTCPHSVMGAVLPHVEVVVGNYYHAFDPTTTGSFTGALLDESTFVVCDEAHMLEPRVRELVSDGVGDATLRDAENELTRVIQPVEFDGDGRESEDAELVRGELEESDVTLRELKETRDFVRDLREELDRRVTAHLDKELPDWRADLTRLDDDEIPLRDPEEPAEDELTAWADEAGYDEGTWVRAETVGAVAARVLNSAEEEDTRRAAPGVGRTLANWARADHAGYFREIELDRTWDESEREDSWRRAYNAHLALHNCIPGDAIAERLGEFGGGVLMSATLAPLDVFREVTGLNALESDDRPIAERTYGLAFPEENRASFAVDAPKFTYGNRGPPGEENPTRRAHVDACAEIARSPGNVLVGMPSYAEAEWMAGELESRLSKTVLLDEASDDGATERLKADFFGGEEKVLVTSLRGTLTEGVDYRGDRLAAAVVCGVPIINTSSPRTRAVKTAYDREFGSGPASGASGSMRGGTSRSGFEAALTVPAVRKARQAIGRVIRGPEEVGVRAFVDARYARDSWDGVREYFPEEEREEFSPVSPDMLRLGVDRFWSSVE